MKNLTAFNQYYLSTKEKHSIFGGEGTPFDNCIPDPIGDAIRKALGIG